MDIVHNKQAVLKFNLLLKIQSLRFHYERNTGPTDCQWPIVTKIYSSKSTVMLSTLAFQFLRRDTLTTLLVRAQMSPLYQHRMTDETISQY
jgi:hypothetical protein